MTNSCESDFVAEAVESTDAHLRVARLEELGKAESVL